MKMATNSITLDVDPSIMEKNMRIIRETPAEEQLNKLFGPIDTVPSRLVKPLPGFCVKTYTKTDNKKVFINICQTDGIPCPRDISNDELMQILSSQDPSSYKVPMSIGEGRPELDKSGAPATAFDIAINPEFFKKIEKDELFQTFFLTVVFEGLQDKYQYDIDAQKYTILKNRKSIGTLQSHRIQARDIKGSEVETKQKAPLIEEINENSVEKIKSSQPAKEEIVHRLRREPPKGNIEYLLAEFQIPSSMDLKDLNLEVGEDRLVLNCKGMYNVVDFYLPCSVDQDVIDALLDRNNNMLSVKMPVLQ